MPEAKPKEGKQKRKPKPTSEKWKKYKIVGDKVERARSCPRCGPGIFLLVAKNRSYCGKCHLTEFVSKAA